MTIRIEHDTFGPVSVPADRLWGAQTQRSLQNFDISGERQPLEMIRALTQVKRASARLGGVRGEGRLVHPTDEVNRSQSSNDIDSTAMSGR